MEQQLDAQLFPSEGGLVFNKQIKDYLLETAKWSKFLAIVGFISIGLFIVFALVVNTIFSSYMQAGVTAGTFANSGSIMMVLYLLLAIIYFLPCLYLYQFAVKIKTGLLKEDAELVTAALGKQKSLYKFFGVFTIVILSLYVLIFIGAIIVQLVK